MGLVEKLHSAKSNFVRWMTSLVSDKEQAKHAWELYKLGATAKNEVIFWQIDAQNQVRGGKTMQYGPDGHRTGYPSWIHTSLKADGDLPQDWTLTQCLFGEHLLPQFPDKPVCIVESEKTAVVMSMFCPKFVWLATGGCNNLRISDMKLLEGRRVIVYPDSGKYLEWLEQVRNCALAYVTVIDYVEQYPPNTDILDIALAELEETPLKPLPSKENIASK